jgi:hypothetical protein
MSVALEKRGKRKKEKKKPLVILEPWSSVITKHCSNPSNHFAFNSTASSKRAYIAMAITGTSIRLQYDL